MNTEPIILNIPLLPATVASRAKYAVSGLHPSILSNNRDGSSEDSALETSEQGAAYPMVSGKDLFGRDIVIPITIRGNEDTMYFPEAVVNISRERNIVATPVLNGKGTVKEMISDGDLKVSISLAIVSTSDDGDYDGHSTKYYDTYPYKGVERLRKLLDEPNRLDIVSEFLKMFDLDGGDFGIVVMSYSVNQETSTNRQIFEISAVSDYDYNLLIEQ